MSLRAWPVVLVLSLVTVSQLSAQDVGKKYRFSEGDVVGDVIVTEESQNISVEINALRSDGLTAGPFTSVQRLRVKYKDSNKAADAQGLTSVRRVYLSAREQKTKQIGKEPVSIVLKRQGTTVSIQRKGTQVTATAVKSGKPVRLPADEIKSITGPFRNGRHLFFPDREVSLGEEWQPDAKFFGSDSGISKTDARARLAEEIAFKGHPCAHITLTYAAEGTNAGNHITMDLSGDVYYALDLQRVIVMKVSGPVAMKGTVKTGGLSAQLEGEGTAEFSVSSTYLQVEGKPAPGAP